MSSRTLQLLPRLVIALLVFGPGKLPDVGKFLGKSLRDFRDALEHRGDEEEPPAPPAVKTSSDEPEHSKTGEGTR